MTGPSSSTLERERKLEGGPGFALPDLTGVSEGLVAVGRPSLSLQATYYDTADLRLARTGISVRFRTGDKTRPSRAGIGTSGTWTVKLPEGERGPSLSRREVNFELPGAPVPDQVAGLLRAHVRSEALVPVGQLRTRRRRIELHDADGRSVVEVDDDEVSVLEGSRIASRFREIEVELLDGAPAKLLDRVAARLRAAGAEPALQTPKIVRALGHRALEPPDVVVPELGRGATLEAVVAAAMASGFTRLLVHDPGIRLGRDPEDVHQARVAARRLRSDLRTFSSLVHPDRARALRAELQWLGGELGHVRDTDVLLQRLRDQAAALPAADGGAASGLLRRLEKEGTASREALATTLDSDRYIALLEDLAEASLHPPVDGLAAGRARDVLPALVREPWKRLRRAVDALPAEPEDDDLHQVRILAKRARYAAEAAAPVLGRPATRFAKAAARLQRVLGDFQDAVVAEGWLRATSARTSPPQAMVAGQLIAMQRLAKEESMRAWPAAWHELAGKKQRSWLS